MYNGHRIIATVCARGGSKGVKNKNIRMLAGKPMICHTLDILRASTLIDNYVISTDSDDIITIVQQYGFDIYFKRPPELAGDKVSRLDPIKHAVQWMEKEKQLNIDIVVDLGVATPLKNLEDVETSIRLLVDQKASNVFSVTPSERNPYYNMVEVVDMSVRLVKTPVHTITDRRDVPAVYNMNDGVNVWWKNVLFAENSLFLQKTMIYSMPRERSIDIDEEFDFLLAEFLLSCAPHT